MKRKIVIGLLCSMLTAGQVFAMEIVNGKLLQHKEWGDAKTKLITKELAIDKSFMARMKQHQSNIPSLVGQYIYANAKIPLIGGIIWPSDSTFPKTVDLGGSTGVYVSNIHAGAQQYTISRTLCVDSTPEANDGQWHEPPIQNCLSSSDTVSLNPGGSFNLYERTGMDYPFTQSGTYFYSVILDVMDGQGNTLFTTSDGSQISIPDDFSDKKVGKNH